MQNPFFSLSQPIPCNAMQVHTATMLERYNVTKKPPKMHTTNTRDRNYVVRPAILLAALSALALRKLSLV